MYFPALCEPVRVLRVRPVTRIYSLLYLIVSFKWDGDRPAFTCPVRWVRQWHIETHMKSNIPSVNNEEVASPITIHNPNDTIKTGHFPYFLHTIVGFSYLGVEEMAIPVN